VTLFYELGVDRVKANYRVKYLGQRPLRSKLTVKTHTHTHTHTQPTDYYTRPTKMIG